MTANSIYVSNSGDDGTGDGSISTPYETLAHVSTVVVDSTTIYLERGSVFEDDRLIIDTLNNIIVDSYGSGDTPKISGLKSITGFGDLGGNIWSVVDANLPSEITNVFIGGNKALIGRLAASTATGGSNSTLVDSTLDDGGGYWDDAEIVIRYYDWTRGISRVSSFVSDTFTFPIYYQDEETGYYYSVSAGKSYHIQNHVNCLTAQDEWAYNPSTSTLYIYSTTEPTGVTCTYGDDLIYIVDSEYVIVQNIDLYGAAQNSIQAKDSSYVTFSTVKLEWSGIYGFFADAVKNLNILNCEGYDQNNDFIQVSDCVNVVVDGNTALRCGVDPAAQRYMPIKSRGGTCAINTQLCSNVVIINNEVAYTCYTAIGIFYTHKFLVEKNYVHHYTLNKTDGGGIYVVSAARHFMPTREWYPITNGRILKNIVTDGVVAENSSSIYVDNHSQDIEIAYNFVNAAKYGFHLHDSALINLHDNIILMDESQDGGLYHSVTNETSIRSVIDNNTFIHRSNDVPSVYVNVGSVRIQTYINNEYYYPTGKITEDIMFEIGFQGWHTLAEWIADESRVTWTRTGEVEIDTSVSPRALPEHNFVKEFVNPSSSVIDVESTDMPYDDYVEYDDTELNFPVVIPANSAKVFVRKPAPEYYMSRVVSGTPTSVEIEYTVRLDETSIPGASAFTLPDKSISNVAISGNIVTLTVSPAYGGGDDLSIDYTKPGSNPLTVYYGSEEMDSFSDSLADLFFTLTVSGDGSGVAALRVTPSEEITATVDGTAKLYDDAAGTENEETTKTIPAGAWFYLYIRCPSGTAALSFSNGKKLTHIRSWASPTNAPLLSGDLGQFSSLVYVLIAAKNTISGDVTKFPMIGALIVYDSNTLSGDIAGLELLGTCIIQGSNTVTFSSVARLKRLVYLVIDGVNTLTSANVNQILAEVWANRDHTKVAGGNRSIDLTGSPSTGAPTGQGITDKARLQAYRSPYQDPDYAVWTVLTR